MPIARSRASCGNRGWEGAADPSPLQQKGYSGGKSDTGVGKFDGRDSPRVGYGGNRDCPCGLCRALGVSNYQIDLKIPCVQGKGRPGGCDAGTRRPFRLPRCRGDQGGVADSPPAFTSLMYSAFIGNMSESIKLPLLTIEQVATYTGLSVHTLYTMVSQRRIPFVKVGRLVRFDPGHLEDWLANHTVMPLPSKRA